MKAVIIVLVLLLLLFAVGVGAGFSRGNHPSSSSSSKEAENYQPGGFETAMDKVVGPFRPAPDIAEKKILPGQTVKIPASKSPVRTLKLKARPGCQASARYEAAAPPKKDVNPIELKFPREGKGDRMLNSLPLLKEAGSILDVKCTAQHTCPGLEVVRD